MSPAPRPLNRFEMMALASHNARVYETEHGVPLRMPAPEHGPGAEWIVMVGSPDEVYAPHPEVVAHMRFLARSARFWRRVELESQGKVIDLVGPGGEDGGTLVIPWEMLADQDRWQ